MEKRPLEKEKNIEDLNYDPYEKAYMHNISKINRYENTIQITQFIGSLLGIAFFFTIAFFTSNINRINSFIVFSFIASSLISYLVSANFYLKLKDLFDNIEMQVSLNQNNLTEDSDSSKKSSKLSMGSIITYICLNIIFIGVILYTLLLTLKIEGFLLSNYSIIATPLFISIIFGIIYFLFILPAFIQSRFYWPITLLSFYLLSAIAFIALIHNKLDYNTDNTFYCLIFLPILISVFIHSIYCLQDVYNYNSEGENKTIHKILNMIMIILLETNLILIALKLDGYLIGLPNYVFSIIFIGLFIYIMQDTIFFSSEEGTKEIE